VEAAYNKADPGLKAAAAATRRAAQPAIARPRQSQKHANPAEHTPGIEPVRRCHMATEAGNRRVFIHL